MNVASSSIPYGADRQAQYGDKPFVQVVYFTDGEYVISDFASQVRFKDGNVLVDHGGISSGFILIK